MKDMSARMRSAPGAAHSLDAASVVGFMKGTGSLWAITMIGCLIAAVAPFDVNLAAAAGNSVLARVTLTLLMIAVGVAAGKKVGFRVEAHGARHPAWVGVAAAMGVAVYVALIDCALFRSALPEEYIRSLQLPLLDRLAAYMMRAFLETIIYRLFVFSVLMWALGRLAVRGPWALFGAALASQCLCIGTNVVALEHATPAILSYDALRYVAPGVLWSWLYARFGFTTTEVAHPGCHLFLQPLFSVFL